MNPIEPAQLSLADDGTPFSILYADVYHSAAGGHAQACHVFLSGNDLPARWQRRERFVIVETGFGLGVNFMATWLAWRGDAQGCRELHFVSVEKHPLQVADLLAAHAAFPEFAACSQALVERWPALTGGQHRLEFDETDGRRVVLWLLLGDAQDMLASLETTADAFYLDGFSPARNPALWSVALCRALRRLAAPGATLATWSVARCRAQGFERGRLRRRQTTGLRRQAPDAGRAGGVKRSPDRKQFHRIGEAG